MITIPPPLVAQALLVFEQFKRDIHASRDEIAQGQLTELRRLIAHATNSSPFWNKRVLDLGLNPAKLTWREFKTLPVLKREDVQSHSEALKCNWSGRSTGNLHTVTTSGSTGVPLTIEHYKPVYDPIYMAIAHLGDYLHGRDPTKTLCVMGQLSKDHEQQGWTSVNAYLGHFGDAYTRERADRTLASHLDWLVEKRPQYFRTVASYAAELAAEAIRRKIHIPITQLLVTGESVRAHQRKLVHEAFGAKIIDRYSCEELGWIALQCPDHEHMHVLSSSMLVEIVNELDEPCKPGEVGRVLVTGLHSYSQPLIRYEIGDLAEWGESKCSCGSQHPIIKKVWGRIRQRVSLPNGQDVPMSYIGHELAKAESLKAFQIRQYSDLTLELLMALKPGHTLTEQDQIEIQAAFDRNQCEGMPLHVKVVDQIDWGTGFKREEFVRVDAPYVA